MLIAADACRLPFKDSTFDLVFGSPPYPYKGQRYDGLRNKFDLYQWIDFMTMATKEALRVSKSLVAWVVNDPVRKGQHIPAVAGLQWELFHEPWCTNERPTIWHKNSPPNRKDWFGNDWESILFFKKPGTHPYFDWQAVATAPRYTKGGRFRQRDAHGKRRMGNEYPKNKLTRPRDVIRVTVGGGHLGDAEAYENEAPFPEALPLRFILSCSPPGGLVLDPFGGSGTTAVVAARNGRIGVSCDIRPAQAEVASRRMGRLTSKDTHVQENEVDKERTECPPPVLEVSLP